MTHKCEYCDQIIQPGTVAENVKCTCPDECELPETVICDGPICQMKFQVNYLETKLNELNVEVNNRQEAIAKLKSLSNSTRILGFGPKALENLIQTEGLNIPGFFLQKDERFTWDQLKPEDIATLGLTFMHAYETLTKNWAAFLNEKAVKIQIKKEQLASTHEKIKKAQKLRDAKSSDITKTNEPKTRIKLTPFEKLIADQCNKYGWTQEQSIESAKFVGAQGECRNLKELRAIK